MTALYVEPPIRSNRFFTLAIVSDVAGVMAHMTPEMAVEKFPNDAALFLARMQAAQTKAKAKKAQLSINLSREDKQNEQD